MATKEHPTMNRRHFELIAKVLKEAEIPKACKITMVAKFCAELSATSQLFNRERFTKASLGIQQS